MSQETGHAKNVANFFRLITFCQSYGSSYNPVHRTLQISELMAIHQNAENAITNHHNQKASYKIAILERQNLFKLVNTLPIRIVGVLKSNFADPKNIADAQHYVQKMRGERIIKPPKAEEAPSQSSKTPPNETETPKKPKRLNSVSQRSYDQQINHFSQLVSLLANNGGYQTNEADLQIFALHNNLNQLQTINQSAISAEINLNATLSARNKALYLGQNNLLELAQSVKNYVKSVFGIKSQEYKTIAALKFTKLRSN